MSAHNTRVSFQSKKNTQNLKSRGVSGRCLAVQCKNLLTGDIREFDRIVDAAYYIIDNTKEDSLVYSNVYSTISVHIRKEVPTPCYGHLFRVKEHETRSWPDYSHVDLQNVDKNVRKSVYPLVVEDFRTGKICVCHSINDVKEVVGQDITSSYISVYASRRIKYKKRFLFASNSQALLEKKKELGPKLSPRYTYIILDVQKNTTRTCDTSKACAQLLKVSQSSVNTKFHYSVDPNTIYYGENNRYKITRALR